MSIELEKLLDALFLGESTIGKIVFRQSDLRIIAANELAERLYGYKPGELRGRTILDLTAEPEATCQMIESKDWPTLGPSARRKHRRKDGSEFVAEVGYDRSECEGQIYMCKYVQDASGTLRTERLLSESTERFRAVADYTYDWESWIQSDGKLIWVNPAVERLTGFTVQECFEMSDYPTELVDPQDRPLIRQIVDGAIAGDSGNDVEFRVITKSGNCKWFAVSWQPLMEANGKAGSFRMSMRDIEDRKQMEQALREHSIQLEELANRRAVTIIELEKKKLHTQKLAAMGEMAASIAHEINNPLAGVKNAIKLVGDEKRLGSQSRELLLCIDKEIDRIAKLVQQFHQLCRPSLGVRVEVDLLHLIHEIIGAVEAQCPGKIIVSELIDWPEQFRAELHEPELRQILHNLLLNAFEASTSGQKIQIVFANPNEHELILSIVDHGTGIDPENLSQVFEPFFTTKYVSWHPGTGLGLAISRSLAIALGGSIEVQSQQGRGSTFVLRLQVRSVTRASKTSQSKGTPAWTNR